MGCNNIAPQSKFLENNAKDIDNNLVVYMHCGIFMTACVCYGGIVEHTFQLIIASVEFNKITQSQVCQFWHFGTSFHVSLSNSLKITQQLKIINQYTCIFVLFVIFYDGITLLSVKACICYDGIIMPIFQFIIAGVAIKRTIRSQVSQFMALWHQFLFISCFIML